MNKLEFEFSNQLNIKIGEIITKFISQITGKISLNDIKIIGIDNIPNDGNFLLISNHPSYIDGKVLDDIFQSIGINIPFICHGNLLKIPFVGKYLKSLGYHGVYNFRRKEYYEQKGINIKKAEEKVFKRIKDAKVNISSIKKSIINILNGGNLGIFITGGGYKDKPSTIRNGYKLIIKKIIQKDKDIIILPVRISFIGGYKSKGLVLRSNVVIEFLKPLTVNGDNQEESYKKIKNLYIK
ncbi:MAG: 1-acyl-sn-glycerol-3-phosphate acyltransferase [Candidatus Gracilibacteria bacterium]|nr:1-acyl-sn-glycerol-3-phosphate acyltransferase [Candidatus Gracilibacteria bacterium]MDQ7023444.1 1-acyl-sn-glycerol-3-phosphate acyltransferase [Candidatus Gracilibacteria bacterium]